MNKLNLDDGMQEVPALVFAGQLHPSYRAAVEDVMATSGVTDWALAMSGDVLQVFVPAAQRPLAVVALAVLVRYVAQRRQYGDVGGFAGGWPVAA